MQGDHDVHDKIKRLETQILTTEDNIAEFTELKYDAGIKKALRQLESDLRYMSILANGTEIDKDEDRRIMDFLRIHYERLRKMSVTL